MTTIPSTPPLYPKPKIALLILLMVDAFVYAFSDTASRALDAFAWLLLLILFEMETEFGWHPRVQRSTSLIHGVRIVAIGAATVASIAYFAEQAWLDTINAALWLAVIVMLEWEVRLPPMAPKRQRVFFVVTALLYLGLAALVVLWAIAGEWLDAYDALLWIVAYVAIELDVFRFSQRSGVEASATPPQ